MLQTMIPNTFIGDILRSCLPISKIRPKYVMIMVKLVPGQSFA